MFAVSISTPADVFASTVIYCQGPVVATSEYLILYTLTSVAATLVHVATILAKFCTVVPDVNTKFAGVSGGVMSELFD